MVLTNFSGGITMKKKTTKGRKKIEIKKIEETNSRQVTFSKRRTGLFKKASELCVLTGAQVAILVNSPGGRVFAFGHPNADDIVDRYLNQEQSQLSIMNLFTPSTDPNANNKDTMGPLTGTEPTKKYPQSSLPMNEFNQHYAEVSRDLEMEKRLGEMIPETSCGVAWFDEPIDGLDVDELERYLYSLNEMKKKVLTRADERMMIKNTPSLLGSNRLDIRWNSNFQMDQTAGVCVPSNTAVYGGFNFRQLGDIGKF